MDAELKQFLIGMEERLKGSVIEMEERLRGSVIEMEERLKEYVNERCELVETKLLTEFHKWASPAEGRHRTLSAALRAIDLEIASNKDLAKKLEGRPPQ